MKKLFFSGYLIALFLIPASQAQRTVGLLQIDTTKADYGYTLFAPLNSNVTYLIDRCGQVVNTWTTNYTPGAAALLTPEGNLLRAAFVPNIYAHGGAGGRFEMFNWEGDLVWEFNYNSDTYTTHHDIMLLPNGHILAIATEKMGLNELAENGFDTTFFERDGKLMDYLIEIEMVGRNQGKIVWEWHVKDHLIQDKYSDRKNYGVVADHPELVNINYVDQSGFGIYDWLHINSVDFNPEFNQIMMSPLFFNELWIIEYNGNSADAKGHTKGNYKKGGDLLYRWGNPETYNRGNALDRMVYNMHNPHWIKPGLKDAGKIMFFHNGVSRPGGNFSSVDIISPPVNSSGEYSISSGLSFGPGTLSWTYSNPGKFYSAFLSGAERLPNGNTFICSGGPGKFFEIDANKKIVWEYVNPMAANGPVKQGSPSPNSSVFRSTRYQPNFKGFDGISLNGSDPLELNPFTSLCKKAWEIAPVCNFTASKQILFVDEETILSDQSTGVGINSRKWKITDEDGKSQNVFIVNGDTNSSASVTVKFGVKGFYTVRLEVTNAFGNDVEIKNAYLNVSQKTEGISLLPGESQNFLLVFPNPSNGHFTVSGFGFELTRASLILKDLMGRSLIELSDISGSALVDLGNLQSGLYEIIVLQDGKAYHKKIQVLVN